MPEFILVPFFFFLGAIFGSFSNVVILRLPKGESLLTPSHCTNCQKKIPWKYNIPILSWLFLKGRCAFCRKQFSARYCIVESIMALLFAFFYYRLGLSWYLLEMLIYVFASVTASVIDLDHMILPDEFTVGGMIVGLIGAALNPERQFLDALIGAGIGGGFLFFIGYLFLKIRKKEGMGGGDIKLMAWIGALMGIFSLPFVLFVASIFGSLHALFQMYVLKKQADEGFPFGPSLVLASYLYVLIGPGTIVQFLFPS